MLQSALVSMSTLHNAAVREPKITSPASPATRLMSLDLFRGATIALMILVNDAGNEEASYWPLKHAAWNGWTPTDLVFPFFLFAGSFLCFQRKKTMNGNERRRRF